MKQLKKYVAWALLAVCSTASADEAVQSAHAIVIAGHPEATKLGLAVLRDGGNAIDALVTTSLSLGVAEPGNSGLGGKFVMEYYDAKSGKVTTVVAMDAAPVKVPVEQVVGSKDEQRERGWGAVCTPGLAAALGEAHAKWGSKPWKSLVTPAAELANRGVKLDQRFADMLSEFPPQYDPTACAIYAPTGKTLGVGEVLRNPDLSKTLQSIADNGYRAFYTGPIAQKIVAASQKAGGYLTMQDFASYKPRFIEPLHGTYRGRDVYTSPPPLTGGTTLLACLKCLENADFASMPDRDTQYIDLIGHVLQQVYPATTTAAADVPDSMARVQQILSPASISTMWDRAQGTQASKGTTRKVAVSPFVNEPLAEATLDDGEEASTTHLIIVDNQGNIACVTQSLGLHFGAGVVAAGTGVLFNGDISNFSFGSKSSPNFIAPGKWPRSTMTPTIFLKNGKPELAIGSPAGQRIPTAVLQVSLDVLDYGRDLKDAIRAARFHVRRSTGKNDPGTTIDIEAASPANLDDSLGKLGWTVDRRQVHDFYFGSVNAVEWSPGGLLTGVADQRRTSDAGTE